MTSLESLRFEDLNQEQQAVAELIGLDNYILLVENFAGTPLYIPKLDDFFRVNRNEQIRQEYDGENIRALAHKYKLCEVQIRNILSDTIRELKAKPVDGQMNMFSDATSA